MSGSFERNEGADIAEKVDFLLRKGKWNLNQDKKDLFVGEAEKLLEDEEPRRTEKEDFIIRSVVNTFFSEVYDYNNSSWKNARDLSDHLNKKKLDAYFDSVEGSEIIPESLEIIEDVNIRDVYSVAEEKYRFYLIEKNKSPGYRDYGYLSERLEYWTKAKELSETALEINTNGEY